MDRGDMGTGEEELECFFSPLFHRLLPALRCEGGKHLIKRDDNITLRLPALHGFTHNTAEKERAQEGGREGHREREEE